MYFIRRLIFAVPLLLVISALAFALVHLAPGGPFDRERAPASPEIERNLKAAYHLDEPVWKQYLRFFGLVWQKDAAGHWHHAPASFNISYKYRSHRVSDIIGQALPVSMTLGALAFGFAMCVGLPLGFITAARRGRWQDYAGSFLAVLAVCVPGFVVGAAADPGFLHQIALAAGRAVGIAGAHDSAGDGARLVFLRQNRPAVPRGHVECDAIRVRRRRPRQGPGRKSCCLLKHAVRIAILPVVSFSGPMLADLLTGSFVIENIFQIPGIGVFFINSALNSDYTVAVDLALLYAVLLIGLNLIVDFSYTLLDPRVKYE